MTHSLMPETVISQQNKLKICKDPRLKTRLSCVFERNAANVCTKVKNLTRGGGIKDT